MYDQTPAEQTESDCLYYYVSLGPAMFMMDPSAVPDPAAYSTPPSPRSSAGMEEDKVKQVIDE